MDEPGRLWIPVSTSKIEDLIFDSKSQYTIVIVTHNMQQAARVAEKTGFFLNGRLVDSTPLTRSSRTPATSARKTTSLGGSDDAQTIPAKPRRSERESTCRWRSGQQAIQRAIEAYRVRDLSICDLVSRSEVAINRMERDIDQAALDLLAMEQPTAIDLRFILSVIKINADLERGGRRQEHLRARAQHGSRWAVSNSRLIFRAWLRSPPIWCGRACSRSSRPTPRWRATSSPWTTRSTP